MGKGERERDVRELANALPSVQLDIDPPRDVIRNTLARSVVLVLLSKRTPLWREQVGLPIVEALEQGCEIVTTEETGIASWLAEHGHAVVADAGDAAAVAGAIAARLRGARPPGELLASLPDEDSRIAADAWMFGVTGDPADQECAAVGRAGDATS
jgi:glycosyltransferase involved in cell wall biosynthesis